MTDLQEYIARQYGVECIPGRKMQCPICGHKTFSLKKDGSVAKCFHPTCCWFVAPGHIDPKPSLHRLLSQVQQEWHKCLLAKEDMYQKAGWNYLTDVRGIAAEIIEGAAIGLVPLNPDVQSLLKPILEELKSTNTKKRPGRPRKCEFDPLAYATWLQEQGEKLQDLASKFVGWLAFFYLDGKGRFCAIHFRKPNTKSFSTFKPKGMGLFGADLFVRSESKRGSELDKYGVVVEGEFDCLKIQTALVKAGKRPALVVASGGTSLLDLDALKSIIPKPVICQDRDEAGYEFVERIAAEMNCEVCTPPAPSKDIDDYLRSFGSRHGEALRALIEVVQSRKPKYKPHEAVKEQINQIRCGCIPDAREGDIKMKPHEIDQKVAETILEEMSSRGEFLKDGELAFYFSSETDRLFVIEPEDRGLSGLLNQFGINATERIQKFVVEELYQHAIREGRSTTVHRFSYLKRIDGEQSVLYIAAEGNRMIRLTADSVELVRNGTDGIMFLTTDECAPADISFTHDLHGRLLEEVILDRIPLKSGRLSLEESRYLLKCWVLMLLMRELIPPKPILAMIGPMASGKTTTLQGIGQMLFGQAWDVTPVTKEQRDFDCLITNQVLLALDNVDGKIEWLNDRIAVAATGGVIKLRKLYSDNKEITYPIIACLALTSRTPYFRRGDVADRLLLLEVESLHDHPDLAFQSNLDFLEQVRRNRTELWAELLSLCQSVLGVIDRTDLSSILAQNARMQDFARFTVIVGMALRCEDMARGVWSKLKSIQREFSQGQDPFLPVLAIWAEENAGKEVDSKTLAEGLKHVAGRERTEWPYEGGRSVGQKIKNLWVELKENFTIHERKGATNQAFYRFYPRNRLDFKPIPDDSETDSGAQNPDKH